MSQNNPSANYGIIGNVKAKAVVVGARGCATVNETTTQGERCFVGEEQKQQFQTQIEQLRETLRAMKAAVEAHPTLSADEKEAMVAEIIQHVSALRAVKEKTASVAVGKAAPTDIATAVETTLDRASGVIDKLKTVAQNAGDVGAKLGDFAVKYGPLLLSARRLFGLP